MRKKFDLIVFDWDGTLVDSANAIVFSIQGAARDLGVTEPSNEEARYVIGLGLSEAIEHLFPNLTSQNFFYYQNVTGITILHKTRKYHFIRVHPKLLELCMQKIFYWQLQQVKVAPDLIVLSNPVVWAAFFMLVAVLMKLFQNLIQQCC